MLSNEHGFAHAIWNCARTGLAVQCALVSRCYWHMQLYGVVARLPLAGECKRRLLAHPLGFKDLHMHFTPTATLASNI